MSNYRCHQIRTLQHPHRPRPKHIRPSCFEPQNTNTLFFRAPKSAPSPRGFPASDVGETRTSAKLYGYGGMSVALRPLRVPYSNYSTAPLHVAHRSSLHLCGVPFEAESRLSEVGRKQPLYLGLWPMLTSCQGLSCEPSETMELTFIAAAWPLSTKLATGFHANPTQNPNSPDECSLL